MIDAQALWGLPKPPNTLSIDVRHSCGHIARYPFEAIDAPEGYRMPAAEAERLHSLKASPCIDCEVAR